MRIVARAAEVKTNVGARTLEGQVLWREEKRARTNRRSGVQRGYAPSNAQNSKTTEGQMYDTERPDLPAADV